MWPWLVSCAVLAGCSLPPLPCYGTPPFAICLHSAPTEPIALFEDVMTMMPPTLDTDMSSQCARTRSESRRYCVVAATSITIDATLRATGSRPLVLIANDSITITPLGGIDVGSHRQSPESIGAGADSAENCLPGQSPTSHATSGGGAGGSFIGHGGSGGTGSGAMAGLGGIASETVTATDVAEIRGGCRGQDGGGDGPGAGGHGGGAVFLIAGNRIDVNGAIRAGGAGGAGGVSTASGAGGGGSGGMIGLDAPSIAVTGILVASGGGGGEGGGVLNPSDVPHSGVDATTADPAAGGDGGTTNAGEGGGGSGDGMLDGVAAGGGGVGWMNQPSGGGGGGGGAGIIKAPRSASLGSHVSPAPTLW